MKKLLLLISIFICCIHISFSQPEYKLLPKESVILTGKNRNSLVRLQENRFYLLVDGEGIKLFDHKGVSLPQLELTDPDAKKIKYDYVLNRLRILAFSKDKIVSNNEGYISVFDAKGNLFLTTEIWNKNHYQSQYIKGLRVEMFSSILGCEPSTLFHNDTMILPMRPVVFYKKPKKKDKAARKEYVLSFLFHDTDTLMVDPSYPLFNVYKTDFTRKNELKVENDPKGERIRLIKGLGSKDPRFAQAIKKGYFYLNAQAQIYDYDSVRKEIISGNFLFPEMTLLSLTGKPERRFGQKGLHTTAADTPTKLYKKEIIDSLKKVGRFGTQTWAYRYQSIKGAKSIIYGQIKYDAIARRTYRVYFKACPEPENYLWQLLKSGEEGEEKFDSVTKRNQFYLQIYNHNNGDSLIFDEPVPAPFHILEVKNGELWAVAGYTEKGLKIVKYRLERKE